MGLAFKRNKHLAILYLYHDYRCDVLYTYLVLNNRVRKSRAVFSLEEKEVLSHLILKLVA